MLDMATDSFTNRLWADDDIFARPDEVLEDAKSVIFISTEGTCTEPDYFSRLYEKLQEDYPNLNFAIEVLHHDGDGHSDPESVFRLLEECRLVREDAFLFSNTMSRLESDYSEDRVYEFFNEPSHFSEEEKIRFYSDLTRAGINVDYYRYLKKVGSEREDDVFAIVLDRDHLSHSEEMLRDVLGKARSRGYLFCLTNPCFEFWLLLHLLELGATITDEERSAFLVNKRQGRNTYCSKRLLDVAGHRKSISAKAFIDLYYPNICAAMRRVEAFETDEEGVIQGIGSSLGLLLNEIFQKLDAM